MANGTTITTHRSYSQINNLQTCGEQYRLERIEHVPSRPSCPAVAGSVIHTVTEELDRVIHAGQTDVTALVDLANELSVPAISEQVASHALDFAPEEWKAYGRPTIEKPGGEDWQWWVATGIPLALLSYITWRVEHPEWELAQMADGSLAIEVPFEIQIGTTRVKGAIDRVMNHRDTGGQIILDIKSGRKPVNDVQLGGYYKAIGIPWGGYLYALKTGKPQFTGALDLSHWTDRKLEAFYDQGNRVIELGLFIPHPGEACFHCGVFSACDYAQSSI